MARRLLDLVVRSRDEASAVLNDVTGALRGQLSVLEKFGGRIPVISSAVGASMTAAAMQTKQWIESLKQLEVHLDMEPNKIRKYQFAVDSLGGDFRDFTEIMMQFNNIREEYEKGGAREITQKMKIVGMIKQENDIRKTNEELLLGMANAYVKFEKGGKGAEVLMKTFGERAKDLIPILRKGAEGLQKYIDVADKLQIKLTPEDEKKVAALNEQFAIMRTEVLNFGIVMLRIVYPALQALMRAFNFLLWAIRSVVDFLTPLLEKLVWLRVILGFASNALKIFIALATWLAVKVLWGLIWGIAGLSANFLWMINLFVKGAVIIANLIKLMFGLGTATRVSTAGFLTLSAAVTAFFRATVIIWAVIEAIGLLGTLVSTLVALFSLLFDRTGETAARILEWARNVFGAFSLITKGLFWLVEKIVGIPPALEKVRKEQQGYTNDINKTNAALDDQLKQLNAIGSADPLSQMIREMQGLTDEMIPAYIHMMNKANEGQVSGVGPGSLALGTPPQLGSKEYMSEVVRGQAGTRVGVDLKITSDVDKEGNLKMFVENAQRRAVD